MENVPHPMCSIIVIVFVAVKLSLTVLPANQVLTAHLAEVDFRQTSRESASVLLDTTNRDQVATHVHMIAILATRRNIA